MNNILDTVATTSIIGEDGKELRINSSDFNPDKHKLFSDDSDTGKAAKSGKGGKAAKGAELAKLPDSLNVAGNNGRFFVTDVDGTNINDPRFDAGGYATDIDAWNAIGKAKAE